MAKKRILYIEDNAENRFLVREILELAGYSVLEAEEGSSGILKAVSERPDLVLVDIMMPGLDGREVTTYLRGIPYFEKLPIIALTASVMKGERESALAAGCDGYIQKPVDVVLLPKQIEKFLKGHRETLSGEEELHYLRKHTRQLAERLNQKVHQLSDTYEVNRRLIDQAWVDDLTGLPNQRYLLWRLRNDLGAAKRFGTALSCVMADLDEVKEVSERAAPFYAESILRPLAEIFSANKRGYDVVGRYSRSKLLLAFPVDGQKGIAIAERIRGKVESSRIMAEGNHPMKVTVSFGVAVFQNDRSISETDLIRSAQEALHEASEAGGNRSVMFNDGWIASIPKPDLREN
jgi:diguanylate cyclase (GGDEF)-like protein